MNVAWIFEQWTHGDFDETGELPLNFGVGGMVETHLTKNEGGSYAHAYIESMCAGSGDEILCGVNEPEGDAPSVQFLPSDAINVTVGLRSSGDNARSAGVIYTL